MKVLQLFELETQMLKVCAIAVGSMASKVAPRHVASRIRTIDSEADRRTCFLLVIKDFGSQGVFHATGKAWQSMR